MEWREYELISPGQSPRGFAQKKRTGVSADEDSVAQESSEVAIVDPGANSKADPEAEGFASLNLMIEDPFIAAAQ